jgi:CheY-like chemotaxis protein
MLATKKNSEILLVDDNPGDVDLTSDALSRTRQSYHVNSVPDGAEAIFYLRRQGKYSDAPTPDLIVLDLNLPRRDGRSVLEELKNDPLLSRIPVVVFTTSQSSSDITRCYDLGANCYVHKPGNLLEFVALVQSMADFWLNSATLPMQESR